MYENYRDNEQINFSNFTVKSFGEFPHISLYYGNFPCIMDNFLFIMDKSQIFITYKLALTKLLKMNPNRANSSDFGFISKPFRTNPKNVSNLVCIFWIVLMIIWRIKNRHARHHKLQPNVWCNSVIKKILFIWIKSKNSIRSIQTKFWIWINPGPDLSKPNFQSE